MQRILYAQWRYCGNCNCQQPQIIERSDGHWGESEWKPPNVIEEGPFHSDPEPDELEEMRRWMIMMCDRYGLAVPEEAVNRVERRGDEHTS